MKTYRVIRKSDGVLVYQYQAETPIEWSGMSFAECDHIEEAPTPEQVALTTKFGGRRRLTKLEFIELLGDDFISILTAAKSSVQIEAFIELVRLTTPDPDGCSINLDDPRMQALHQLELAGVIAVGRAEEILNG